MEIVDEKIAKLIFSEIKKSKNILLAVHVSPDVDSLASVLAMDTVLERLRKKTKIISFGQIPPRFSYLYGVAKIEQADFSRVNLDQFELFIALDCAAERMITRSQYPSQFPDKFKIINIDHHLTNTKYGQINLIVELSSTAEIIFELFKIWKIKIKKEQAQLLLAGIFSDTGCFQYPLTTANTLRNAADLIDNGACLNTEVLQLLRSYSLKTLKYWGRILDNLKIDDSGKFVWSTINLDEKEELGLDPVDIQEAANLFAPIVSGTEFGIILIEENDGLTRGSLRSRDNFNVSALATEFGGGGHQRSAGFSLELSLKEAEEKVLEIARKFINQ